MTSIGLLIHGPEVIDEGEAREAIETLKKAGFAVEAALGGITGKTAVIDACMQHVIDISRDMKPSEVMEDFVKRDVTFILLVNHAKTEESGFMLGEGILRRFFDMGGNTVKENISFVQLEYGSGSRIIIRWLLRHDDVRVYKRLTGVFSEFDERQPYKLESRCKKDARSNRVYREIKGVHPGEKIVVDGVVIGMASSSHENKSNSVTLVAKGGKLVDVAGGKLIKHNLKKLPSPLELEKVLVKTASVIRRTKPKRVEVGAGTDGRESQGTGREKKKKRACLFYSVDNLFPKLKDAGADVVVAVTIGDDTTSIAGDILRRFGIRMIGITDGDADGLIAGIGQGAALEQYGRFLPPDSLIIRLKPERDDIIGEKVKEEIFGGAEEIELDGDVEQQIKALKHRILHLAEQDIIGELSSPPITTTI